MITADSEFRFDIGIRNSKAAPGTREQEKESNKGWKQRCWEKGPPNRSDRYAKHTESSSTQQPTNASPSARPNTES